MPTLALIVLVLALSGSVSVAAMRLMVAVGVIGFVGASGMLLGSLARWASAISPRAGRTMLVALVVVPHLARHVWPSVPSVPAWLGLAYTELLRFGSGVG